MLAEGATLSMAAGTAARAGGLRVEMGTQSGTLAGFAPAAQGTLYIDGVDETPRKGLVLPVTVTDAQVKHNLSRWPVVIDGEVDEKVCGRVRDNTIVLESKGGLVLTIR